jgi:hypothetical protein
MRLLWQDKSRFCYDSEDTLHRERLEDAALQPEGYRIYVNLLPKKWKPAEHLKKKIGRYMMKEFPAWTYSPADKLKVTLKDRYGELYLALLWKGQQTEVILSAIENEGLCVTT